MSNKAPKIVERMAMGLVAFSTFAGAAAVFIGLPLTILASIYQHMK